VSTEQARNALEIFEQALAVAPAELAEFLQQACLENEELRAEVDSLLAAHSEADQFLSVGDTDAPRPSGLAPSSLIDNPTKPGARLGDFLIEKQIGAGGMGVVYQAEQISLKRRVALKVLPAHLRFSASAKARFRHEIEAAARLHHSNIVAVHTTGEAEEIQFYAMELIDGPSLGALIRQLRASPIPELRSASGVETTEEQAPNTICSAADLTAASEIEDQPSWDNFLHERLSKNYFDSIATILAEVADGLAYAHTHKVIHRDIKPSNLLFSLDGRLHVSDFGLARMLEQPGITQTGEFVGTPFYMAPEQVSASIGQVDGRTDIYALGATLYEMLTLQPLFPGESRDQVIAQIGRDEPMSPRRLNKRVPRSLETICLKAIEKDPARRYQTADVMASDLRCYVNRFAISAKRAGPMARGIKWAGRHRALTATLVLSACFALTSFFFATQAHQTQQLWSVEQQNRVIETAFLATMEGDTQRAEDAVEEARQLNAPPGKIRMLEGIVALYSNHYPEAYKHLKQSVALLPEDLTALSLLCRASAIEQRIKESNAIWKSIQHRQPANLTEYLFKATEEVSRDPVQALKTLDDAIRQYPNSVTARLIRGDARTMLAQEQSDPINAEAALKDFEVASEFLGQNIFVLKKQMKACLIAAVAYESNDQPDKRQEQLDLAAEVAEFLKGYPDSIDAYYWRAKFFDYQEEIDLSIVEYQQIRKHRIMFLVISLFQQGRFDEALALCNERNKRYPNSRWTGFLTALTQLATDKSPNMAVAAYFKDLTGFLDPSIDLLFSNTLLCLSGNIEEARLASVRIRDAHRESGAQAPWFEVLLEFCCGNLSPNDLLEQARTSRSKQIEGNFVIAITELAQGHRQAARMHFLRCAELRTFNQLHDAISRAILAQMDRNPNWPAWVKADSAGSF